MKAKVMVVDDNSDVLYVVKDCLGVIAPDYAVTCVSSGKECLDKVKTVEPDIILMDLMMPGMDGREVVTHLKKDDKTRNIPVIYLTGRTDEIIRNTSEGCIEKPFDMAELKNKIEEVLSNRR